MGHPLSNEYMYQDFLLTGEGREFFEIFFSGQPCNHFLKYQRETTDADCVCPTVFERAIRDEQEIHILKLE